MLSYPLHPPALSSLCAFCWEHSYCHPHPSPNAAQNVRPHRTPHHIAINPESPNQRETEPVMVGFSDLLKTFYRLRPEEGLVQGNQLCTLVCVLDSVQIWELQTSGTQQEGPAEWLWGQT